MAAYLAVCQSEPASLDDASLRNPSIPAHRTWIELSAAIDFMAVSLVGRGPDGAKRLQGTTMVSRGTA
jgi:hypothetical protein